MGSSWFARILEEDACKQGCCFKGSGCRYARSVLRYGYPLQLSSLGATRTVTGRREATEHC